jgi:spore maturation protein CgeB
MRILYVGASWPHGTALHRRAALVRLGHAVSAFDGEAIWQSGGRARRWLAMRTLRGAGVRAANRALADEAARGRYDLVWLDKPLFVTGETVQAIRRSGARTVQYNLDNPFGPRGDPGWRLLVAAIPDYDVHLVPRRSNLDDYRRAGARRVLYCPLAYEPSVHFPPDSTWSDAARPYAVTFIGAAYDDRPRFIAELRRRTGVDVRVWGARWGRHTGVIGAGVAGGPVYGDAYRETIWRSRILLGLVTHANRDETAGRCFEVAACGGFLLAERTPGNLEYFAEDREAAYFSDVEECAARIHQYLADEPARAAIAATARARAEYGGYSNDARLAAALAEIVA